VVKPTWVTAFLEFPAASFDAATAFWRAVTGSGLSAPRGELGEAATLLPRHGDPYLKVKRVDRSVGGIQLDLHTDDMPALVGHAKECGADGQFRVGDYTALTSPGGYPFRVVIHPAGTTVPSPVPWWGGLSIVDQVCLDIPGPLHEAETEFWSRLTGWEHAEGRFPEFSSLERPAGQPLRLLLQRLDSDDGPVRAHLDLSSSDRLAEVVRHRSIGAELVREPGHWTVLRDPAGLEYCVTDRDPTTGTLPPIR
jgi:glyoxalase superfamily protein